MRTIHVNRVACGIHVVVHGNIEISKILDDYSDVFAHSSSLSLLETGTVVIYLKSTYQELESDTHEYIHEEDITRTRPILTEREKTAINKLTDLCYCNPERLIWIHHADTFNIE